MSEPSRPPLCSTVEELIAATGARSLSELGRQASDETEPFECALVAESPVLLSGVVVGFSGVGINVELPATVDDFWDHVHEAEGEARCVLAVEGFVREVIDLEGFQLGWGTGGYPSGFWPPNDFPVLPDYPYETPAPDGWTVGEWFTKRIGHWADLHTMLVDLVIADVNGEQVPVDMTLDEVRRLASAGLLYDGQYS